MQELEDIALLRKYVDDGSEEAFAALVTRHVNKVYSVALRHTGNPHEAEEITQAVFVILARKSRHLGKRVILSGWLYHTARLTALTFIRSAIRRARREQEAFMQSEPNGDEAPVWKQIAPLLDTAMAGLNETDRHAVVLRFFDGKSMMEIGAALGANEVAARKRVGRALDKLQKYFSARGVHSTTDTIAQAISNNSVQTAPALLAQTATAAALAKGAAAGSSILTLVKATLIAMKTKTIVATVATTIIVAGIATWFAGFHLFQQPKAALPSATPIDSVPMAFDNAAFKPDGDRDGTFVVEVDPNTLRTSNSAPAIHIKGPVAEDGRLTNGGSLKTDNSSSTKYLVTQSSVLFGKHIGITGWLKTSDVKGWGSAFMIILGLDGTLLKVDSMGDRFIHGTTGWQQVEFVTDVPKQPCIIYFGPDLYGPGELWGDDFQINLAPPDAPVTDDSTWCQTMSSPGIYSEEMDFHNLHNGHHTVCLAYLPNGEATVGAWTWWGQKIRPPFSDKYLGHTMRMTGWIKTENVSGRLEPTIRPWDINRIYGKDSMTRDNSLKGTRDWTKFSVTCAVPDDAQHIDTAFILWGSGKAWIDMDSLKFEIVK